MNVVNFLKLKRGESMRVQRGLQGTGKIRRGKILFFDRVPPQSILFVTSFFIYYNIHLCLFFYIFETDSKKSEPALKIDVCTG